MSSLVAKPIKDQIVTKVTPISTEPTHEHKPSPVQEYREHVRELSSLEKHIKGLKGLDKTIESLWNRAESEERELVKVKGDFKVKIKKSSDALAEMTTKYDATNGQLATLRHDFDYAKKQHETERQKEKTKLAGEITKLRESLAKTEKERDSEREKSAKTAEELTKVRGSLAKVEKERDSVKVSLENTTAELKKERENGAKIAIDLEKAKATSAGLEKDLEETKKELQEEKNAYEEKKTELEEKRKELKKARQAEHDAEESRNVLEEKRDKAVDELEAIKGSSKAQAEISKLRADLDTFLPPADKRNQRVYIHKVIYGGVVLENPEVLQRIQKVADTQSKFTVNNTNCGGDPWRGTTKTFVVSYMTGGKGPMKYYCAQEGNTVEFP